MGKRKFIRIGTSEGRIDPRSMDGWVVIAVALNIIVLMILFKFG